MKQVKTRLGGGFKPVAGEAALMAGPSIRSLNIKFGINKRLKPQLHESSSRMKFWQIASIVVVVFLIGSAAWLYTPDKKVTELESIYLRAPTDYVEVAGIRLHVRDDGPQTQNKDVPAVILLHGFGASLLTWEPWAAQLKPDMRVIRFDLPGFGLTGPDPTGDYSDTRSLQILTALMDKLGLARANVVGNSIGGRIAWKFAAAHPERVEKLVLIAPDGFASPGFEYGKAPELSAAMKLMRYVMPAAAVKMSMAPAYGDTEFMSDSLVTRYRDLMLAPGVRDAMIARMAQSILVRPEAILKSIQTPTLLGWGEKDQMIPFANSKDYLRLLPHADLTSFPRLGHLPFEEAPGESLVPVRAFLMSPPVPLSTTPSPK